MNTCKWLVSGTESCGKICEGKNALCATHAREARKLQDEAKNQSEKLALKILKSNNQEPRKKPSKNPKDWKNTFLCSDGTRVTQAEINERLQESYRIRYTKGNSLTCDGCGAYAESSAHIIPKARCKQLHKTELIWTAENYFPACYDCNLAIEAPKGTNWAGLRNIDECVEFIREHDAELYAKFENNGYQAKIKPEVTI